jgi:hypothetical protein
MKKEDNKALGYHSQLGNAIKFITKQNLISQKNVYTLKEYIEQYEETFNKLTQKFNI